MLIDSGDLSGHGRLNSTCEITCRCGNHDLKLAVEATKATCSKGRLETNTLVYILADYIQVPELEALAVRNSQLRSRATARMVLVTCAI